MKELLSLIVACALFTSCSPGIDPKELQGAWLYTKVESRDPEGQLSDEEVRAQSPSIVFSGDSLEIIWGGSRLSHGSFHVEGDMIRYKEILGTNQTREFPFLVKKLTADQLVFSTMEQNYTTVTASKDIDN